MEDSSKSILKKSFVAVPTGKLVEFKVTNVSGAVNVQFANVVT